MLKNNSQIPFFVMKIESKEDANGYSSITLVIKILEKSISLYISALYPSTRILYHSSFSSLKFFDGSPWSWILINSFFICSMHSAPHNNRWNDFSFSYLLHKFHHFISGTKKRCEDGTKSLLPFFFPISSSLNALRTILLEGKESFWRKGKSLLTILVEVMSSCIKRARTCYLCLLLLEKGLLCPRPTRLIRQCTKIIYLKNRHFPRKQSTAYWLSHSKKHVTFIFVA